MCHNATGVSAKLQNQTLSAFSQKGFFCLEGCWSQEPIIPSSFSNIQLRIYDRGYSITYIDGLLSFASSNWTFYSQKVISFGYWMTSTICLLNNIICWINKYFCSSPCISSNFALCFYMFSISVGLTGTLQHGQSLSCHIQSQPKCCRVLELPDFRVDFLFFSKTSHVCL